MHHSTVYDHFSETSLLLSGDLTSNGHTTAYLYMAAFLSAVGGFLFGYDTGVVSGALLQVSSDFILKMESS